MPSVFGELIGARTVRCWRSTWLFIWKNTSNDKSTIPINDTLIINKVLEKNGWIFQKW
jgi:hypothetical protein